ncbi:hypothetical protein B1748_04250 [Paenibacillus sp. MY03]|uniref:hypothetical protein n=1 Tax=Paenibacillus sp. MY03 TaxID=302980 RepID=UPI000B3C9FCE|nr:hypothetical protein [Paenibacillus sp. MY03]OUS77988.1 hypothetical protein B1748_04250 [Paenibacillus sp. MY03]
MSQATKTAMERTVVLSIAAVYMVQQLTGLKGLQVLLGILVFAAIGLLLPKLKGMTLWLSSSFLLIGAILMFVRGADAAEWFQAAGINVTIVTLFLFAPLFGIPVRLPEYVAGLKRLIDASARSRTALLTGTQLLTQVLGVFLNVGAIPVVYGMVFVMPQPLLSRLLAGALNRGFAGAIFWSPYFAAMTIITTMLELSWSSILPYALGLAVLSLLVSMLANRRELKELAGSASMEAEEQGGETVPFAGQDGRKTDEASAAAFPKGLVLYLALTMAAILLLERMVPLPMVMLICFSAVVLPLLWCVFRRSAGVYADGLKHHLSVTFPALQKEITLFLAAGFFSGAIGATGFGAELPAWLGHIPLPVSLTFSAFTVLLIAGTSLIGLHPIVPVTILAGGIVPESVGISGVYFAVLLLGSWGLSNPISPATAVNNLLAGLTGRTPFQMASDNYRFASWMALLMLLYLAMVGWLVPG